MSQCYCHGTTSLYTMAWSCHCQDSVIFIHRHDKIYLYTVTITWHFVRPTLLITRAWLYQRVHVHVWNKYLGSNLKMTPKVLYQSLDPKMCVHLNHFLTLICNTKIWGVNLVLNHLFLIFGSLFQDGDCSCKLNLPGCVSHVYHIFITREFWYLGLRKAATPKYLDRVHLTLKTFQRPWFCSCNTFGSQLVWSEYLVQIIWTTF